MTAAELSSPAAPAREKARAPELAPTRRRRSVIVYLCYAWLTTVVLLAVTASWLPLADYALPVGKPRQSPDLASFDGFLGTDSLGRSILSRSAHGSRVSLLIGLVAGLSGFAIGSTLGLIAGFFGGLADRVITLIADAMLAFPPLILLLALSSVMKPSISTIGVGLTLLVIPTFIRLARANTLAWSAREFVRAARNMGAGNRRILVREILPNVLPSLAAYLPIVIAALIVAEGSLSFLGLGIPPPRPSWGGMINDGKDLIAETPHIVFAPALVVFLTVFSLNQIGDHLRLRFDRTLHD